MFKFTVKIKFIKTCWYVWFACLRRHKKRQFLKHSIHSTVRPLALKLLKTSKQRTVLLKTFKMIYYIHIFRKHSDQSFTVIFNMAALAVFWKIRQICVIYYFTKATGLIWYYIGSESLAHQYEMQLQETPQSVGHFDFQDDRHYRGNEVM
jgi:hypothetical protein